MQHPQSRSGGDGYHKLAQHYGWALQQVFQGLFADGKLPVPPRRVIVLEEDLEVGLPLGLCLSVSIFSLSLLSHCKCAARERKR